MEDDLMTKINSRNNLLEELVRFARRQAPLAHQIVKELAPGDVFKHQIQIFTIFVNVNDF